MNIHNATERYIEQHDLRGTTEAYYRRIAGVFSAAHPDGQIDSGSLSSWLRELQQAGLSSYYRKSLRNGLAAVLRFGGDVGRIRPVKLEPLTIETWDPQEVARLIAAATDPWWASLIEAAWFTGLSGVDLLAVTRDAIDGDGILRWHRSRTGRPVAVYCPLRLVEHVDSGKVWPWPFSVELFRRRFSEIVAEAGLTGTFKRLRKSAGSNVEEQAPGRGHLYLANTRAVFEAHYLRDSEAVPVHPVDLPRFSAMKIASLIASAVGLLEWVA